MTIMSAVETTSRDKGRRWRHPTLLFSWSKDAPTTCDVTALGVATCLTRGDNRPPTHKLRPPLIARHARVHRPAKGSRRLRRMARKCASSLANSPSSLLGNPWKRKRERERAREKGKERERKREKKRERSTCLRAYLPAWPLLRGRLGFSTSTTPSLANLGRTKLNCTY